MRATTTDLPARPARLRATSAANAGSALAPQRAPKPNDLPKPTDAPVRAPATPTNAPVRAPATPTNAPIHAVVATRPPQPIQAATVTPAAPAELRFRTSDPEDHYVAVREQPTTKSREIGRLSPGDVIVCSDIVAGETLEYLAQKSNRWAICPSVGGSIFLPLLIPIRAEG